MQTRGAGIGGPIAKSRFMSSPQSLNSLKPLNSAPLLHYRSSASVT
jgi:hypothetical protein